MIRATAIGVLAGAALFASPAAAQSETYCVKSTACPADHQTNTLAQALALTADPESPVPDKDRILIGPGTLEVPQTGISAENPVDIEGAGPTTTLLVGNDPQQASGAVLQVRGDTTLSNLGLRVGTGTDSALVLGGTSSASNVDIDATTAAGDAIGVYLQDSSRLSRSTVKAPKRPSSAAIFAEPYGNAVTSTQEIVRVSDVYASGGTALFTSAGVGGTVDAQRLRLDGGRAGAVASDLKPNTRFGHAGGTFRLSSSLVTVSDQEAQGLLARNAVFDARHVTIVRGTTPSGSDASGAEISRGGNGTPSSLRLRDSIIDGFDHSISEYTSEDKVDANVSSTNYDKDTVQVNRAPGTVPGSDNLDVSPGFRGAGDYQLAATSPLIDKGTASGLDPNESTTDLAGAARLADGNDDGITRSDIGAYEYPDPTPPVDPGAGGPSGGGAGSNVTLPRPGAPTAPSASPSVLDVTAPSLASPSLSRSSFSVASASTALTAAARGTTLRYRLSEAARVRIAVERRGTGASVKRGKKRVCLARTKARGKAKRCTRYTSVRTLTRKGKAGPNTLDFTGRLAGRALKPGRYRFVITATDSAGNRSMPRTIAFRIVR